MNTYLVFIIFAYQQQTEQGQFMESTELQLIAKSPDEAIKKAKKLVNKKFYYLKTIIEKYEEK